MTPTRYSLKARVSTDNPTTVKPVLARLVPQGSIVAGPAAGEFQVRAEMEGPSARDLNRHFLSELRRTEKKTRLRADWTAEGVTERFFDYVPKGKQRA